MWDFEGDGAIDSEHAQHMSDVGAGTEWGAVFGVQTDGGGQTRGRTGFMHVPMSRDAKRALLEDWGKDPGEIDF
jgi:hypothetical protein